MKKNKNKKKRINSKFTYQILNRCLLTGILVVFYIGFLLVIAKHYLLLILHNCILKMLGS